MKPTISKKIAIPAAIIAGAAPLFATAVAVGANVDPWPVTFGVGIVAFAGAYFASKLLSAPADEAIDVVDRYHKGERNIRATVSSNDEIGMFARQVNGLFDAIAEGEATRNDVDNEVDEEAEALRLESISQLQAISRSQAVIEFNMDGTIITANDNFLNTVGYSLAEIQGQHHSIFVDEAYKKSMEYNNFWTSLSRGEYQAAEYKRIAKGGKEVWIQASYNPILDIAGKPFKVVKFATDITEARTEAQKNTALKSALEGSGTATILCDRDLVITYANPSTVNMLQVNLGIFQSAFPGFDINKLIGTCIDIFHKNPAHQRNILNNPANMPYQTEIQVGELFFSLNVSAMLNGEGKYIGNSLEWADVTKTKADAEKNAALSSAIEGSATASITCDRDLVITYANPATTKMVQANLPSFQKAFPGVDFNNIIGSCIDIFHKNPNHQRNLLSNPANLPYQTDIQIGKLTFALNVSAMRDIEGNYIGSSLEWSDATAARASETRAASLFSMSESVNTNLMICDLDLVITYCNPAVTSLMSQYQSELGKIFRNFDARNLVGRCIDDFHKNPAHQRQLLGDPRNLPAKSDLKIGELELGVYAMALTDANGEFFAIAVQWIDNNERGKYRNEVDKLIHASKSGDLSFRGDVSKLDEVYQPMLAGINDIIDAIVAPIDELKNRLEMVAQSDMTAFVTGDYQGDHESLKNALNDTLSNMNEILGQVREGSFQMSQGASQVSSSSQQISQGATEQAASLEEITASMNEIATQTKQNADNATDANNMARQTQGKAQSGSEMMSKMVDAMGEIDDSAQKIGKIIKVIDEIAFQTNLLALNAAVEAARAGVHGKGFAVVAEEVRNLAARSANAAKETTELIDGAIRKVNAGTEVANTTSGALQEIVQGVTQASELVSGIANASNEQALGIDQVNQGLTQLDQVTQQNTANAEESAAAAVELSEQVNELTKLIQQFKLTNESNSNSNPAPVRSTPTRTVAAKPSTTRPRAGSTPSSSTHQDLIPLDDLESDMGRY